MARTSRRRTSRRRTSRGMRRNGTAPRMTAYAWGGPGTMRAQLRAEIDDAMAKLDALQKVLSFAKEIIVVTMHIEMGPAEVQVVVDWLEDARAAFGYATDASIQAQSTSHACEDLYGQSEETDVYNELAPTASAILQNAIGVIAAWSDQFEDAVVFDDLSQGPVLPTSPGEWEA